MCFVHHKLTQSLSVPNHHCYDTEHCKQYNSDRDYYTRGVAMDNWSGRCSRFKANVNSMHFDVVAQLKVFPWSNVSGAFQHTSEEVLRSISVGLPLSVVEPETEEHQFLCTILMCVHHFVNNVIQKVIIHVSDQFPPARFALERMHN